MLLTGKSIVFMNENLSSNLYNKASQLHRRTAHRENAIHVHHTQNWRPLKVEQQRQSSLAASQTKSHKQNAEKGSTKSTNEIRQY